jgi:hypothetical protein
MTSDMGRDYMVELVSLINHYALIILSIFCYYVMFKIQFHQLDDLFFSGLQEYR